MAQKEFMPVSEIKQNILSQYPYEVYEIVPIKFKDTNKQRAVYKFLSNKGPKCLKKVYFDEANLLFVYSVIEWLFRWGIKVPNLLPTKDNKRFVKYKNHLFIVTDWIEGRKCDYDTDNDVCMAAKNLGKMHKCSYGFKPIEGSYIRKDECDWYKSYNKKFLQLLQYYNKAAATNDRFSKIYMESFDYFYDMAKHSVYVLGLINNEILLEPMIKYNTICHLDYVNKNIIFTDSNELYVIDFDKSKIDIPIHDLGTFLKRILKRKNTNWDYNILMKTLENYEQERRLNLTEFLGLYGYLEFPQKYWKVSRDYFNNNKECNKKTLTAILSKICQQKKEHMAFCKKFQQYIEKRYNIPIDNFKSPE